MQQEDRSPGDPSPNSRVPLSTTDFIRARSRRRRTAARWSFTPVLLGGLFAAGFSAAVLAFAIGVAALFAAGTYDGYTTGITDTGALLARLPQGGSRVYDRHGRLLYEWKDAGVRRAVPL